VAEQGAPIARAVDRSFTDSILSMTRIESEAHPERKSILIDLAAVFLTDLPMMGYSLESEFRIPYRFDLRNSSFGTLKAFGRNVEFETRAHYAADRPPLPPILAPGATPPPTPPPPRNLADVRSMLLRFRYSISELPDTAYKPRIADDRVGHFFSQSSDFSDDAAYTTARRYINRWRLEKENPAAALSRPKQPIVFWMENTIPMKYRDAIREGALMWNRAFERIGFQDAIEVRQQPDTSDWDPADVRYNTIRWFTCTDCSFAIGPSRANPLTGELYDADIGFSENITRVIRQNVVELIDPLTWMSTEPAGRPVLSPWSAGKMQYACDLGAAAALNAQFGFEVLQVRGLEPNGPEADKYVNDFLRSISAHEVGHTLGLRHNFRASTIHSIEQVHNADLTRREGITGSVMDYIPANIALKGAQQGEYWQSTLGPYDYWAIEYAYKPINAATPQDELVELRRIASRVAERNLAYATDEDAGVRSEPFDMDPEVSRNDLGADPLQFYTNRVKLAEEIWGNMEQKLQKPGEGYQVLRRSFNAALGNFGTAIQLASKYVGGVHHYRDHVGDPGNRLPLQPVPGTKQKQALALLRSHLFAPKAFAFSPQLLSKLNNERFSDFSSPSFGGTRSDVPIHNVILSLQRSVLDRLYHPLVLGRILDSSIQPRPVNERFGLRDLFTGVQDSIWAEVRSPGQTLEMNSYRRSLQREHVRKMSGMVLRDAAVPEDARTMARQSLLTLRTQLRAAANQAGLRMSSEDRGHLTETIARIDEVLGANAQRTAF
jgi:hypothetical protein